MRWNGLEIGRKMIAGFAGGSVGGLVTALGMAKQEIRYTGKRTE